MATALKCIAYKCIKPAQPIQFENCIVPLCKDHIKAVVSGKIIRAMLWLGRD